MTLDVALAPAHSRGVRRTLWLVCLPLMWGCHITQPSPIPFASWRTTLPQWSPYVVLQPNDLALAGYRDALTKLLAAQAVVGVRVPLFADGRAAQTVALAASLNLEIVGVIDDADLMSGDVVAMFDRYRSTYQQVKTFQIGNEVTTFPGMPMTIERYLDVFTRIYAHVLDRYPDVLLLTQSTFGSGTMGGSDLGATIGRLRSRVSPERVVLAVNVYTNKALNADVTEEAATFGFRIWVTETGIANPAQQVAYVMRMYPLLQMLRPERIYWYALWAGDVGNDSGYSLVTNATHPPVVPSPLFQTLTD
ncbi:MAG TPA: hypothetical protein VLV86_13640 [Vicinamibacterales bacterium]|nr:hypothetical protein [Vicinamibacterales bacterium]